MHKFHACLLRPDSASTQWIVGKAFNPFLTKQLNTAHERRLPEFIVPFNRCGLGQPSRAQGL